MSKCVFNLCLQPDGPTVRVVGTLSPCGSQYEVHGVTKGGRKGYLAIPVEDLSSAYFVDAAEQAWARAFFSEDVVPLIGVHGPLVEEKTKPAK